SAPNAEPPARAARRRPVPHTVESGRPAALGGRAGPGSARPRADDPGRALPRADAVGRGGAAGRGARWTAAEPARADLRPAAERLRRLPGVRRAAGADPAARPAAGAVRAAARPGRRRRGGRAAALGAADRRARAALPAAHQRRPAAGGELPGRAVGPT